MLPRLSVRRYPHQSERHHHAWHQLVLPIDGALGLAVDHREDRLDRSRGAVIAPGESHAFEGIGENRCLVLDAAAASFEGMPAVERWLDGGKSAQYFTVEATVDHLARGLFHLLERAERAPFGNASDGRMHHHGAGLLLLALAELPTGGAQRMPERLQRAIDFIHRRYTSPIQVADIASAASLGVSQMHALFRAFYGTTPMQYVTERRLDLAERMLSSSGRACPSIAEIALRCGYSDQASLTRAMRARRDTTPGALRRAAAEESAPPQSETRKP